MKYLLTIVVATLLYVIALLISNEGYIDRGTSVLFGYFAAYFPLTIYILLIQSSKTKKQ